MHIRRLPPEEAAVRRYVEDLWIPYHRDLEAAVEAHELADDVDLVAEEVPFRLDRLDDEDERAWIAVEGGDPDAPLAETEGTPVGFVTAEVEEAPPVFDRPDRVVVGDFYVVESHRGTGLAAELLDRAVGFAREQSCGQLALDVDVDNDRARSFYEKVGFEPHRYRMLADVDDATDGATTETSSDYR